MSTDLAARNGTASGAVGRPLPEIMERVIAMGDLSRLSAADRIAYYAARCEAADLDPRTQPFQYINLQNKLVLYATKTATDQLIASKKLTVEILDRRHERELGIFEVHCRVRFPDGHHVEDFAALSVHGLRGEALCNALMKCVTKAKRRTVLSACGLGMLDETEVETIPGASRVPDAPDNQSGHGRGQYASEEQTAAYRENLEKYLAKRNGEWLDRWTDEVTGEVPDGVKDLCSVWQADNHLVKWGVQSGRLDSASADEKGVKHRQIGRYTAIIYNRGNGERKALAKELERYLSELELNQEETLRSKHPRLFGDADEAQATSDDDPARDVE